MHIKIKVVNNEFFFYGAVADGLFFECRKNNIKANIFI